MNRKIVAFILGWQWQLKHTGVSKKLWRRLIANKFRETVEYKNDKWTTDEFVNAYNEAIKIKGRLK